MQKIMKVVLLLFLMTMAIFVMDTAGRTGHQTLRLVASLLVLAFFITLCVVIFRRTTR